MVPVRCHSNKLSQDFIPGSVGCYGTEPTIRKHDFYVFITQTRCNTVVAIKILRRALVQIYSLAERLFVAKAEASEASALATNTLVSAINLHQCSAADLNPYIVLHCIVCFLFIVLYLLHCVVLYRTVFYCIVLFVLN